MHRKPTATMDEGWLRRAIEVKRDGGEVAAAVWHRIVAGYVAGSVDEASVAALAMACTIRGMADDEILALTDAMVDSGDTLRFPGMSNVVDKHSSGGVGDTVSLVVVPLVAACGVPVAKLSGRALGHTGGTLDKLEAIPGVRTDLTPAAFNAQLERIGCAIAAQSDRLVPADKRLYALRDRTGSVPSVGLIAASIVSKKIAGGANAIVFDVKVGGGAFLHTPQEALALATLMVRLAERSGRRARAIVTDMDEPLATNVGTGVEAIEARELLRAGLGSGRLGRLIRIIAAEMLVVGGVAHGDVDGRIDTALESGSAYERFIALIEAQGGRRATVEALVPAAPQTAVGARTGGFVSAIDAVAIGEAARDLIVRGGSFAGVRIVAPIGTRVDAGEALAYIAGDAAAAEQVAAAFTLIGTAPADRPLVVAFVGDAPPLSSSK